MSSEEETTVCEICRQPGNDASDEESIVIIMTIQGQEFARHRRCHLLELLDQD